MLQAGGYATGAVVSNPVLNSDRHFTQGFDSWDETVGWREREATATTDAALAWIEAQGRAPWLVCRLSASNIS